MPNRIIKESICSSEKLAKLSDFEFRLWVGLVTFVDDAGRGDARPAIIKGRVFPLRERVALRDIETALANLAANGCVSLYEADGRPYFWFPSWRTHQRVRDCKPKYPEPPSLIDLPQSAAKGGNDGRRAALIQSNTIQSESKSKSNPKDYCPKPETGSAPPVIALPLNDKSEFEVTQADADEWAAIYPAVDVCQELRNMRGWLLSNASKRKTKAGIRRFINGWLMKEQDKGRRQSGGGGTEPGSFTEYHLESIGG